MNLKVNCPICHSTRIRRGYKQTPLWSKLIFRYNILCDNCNWQFVAFALPWQIPTKSTKRSKNIKSDATSIAANESIPAEAEQEPAAVFPLSTEEKSEENLVEKPKTKKKSKTTKQETPVIEQKTFSKT